MYKIFAVILMTVMMLSGCGAVKNLEKPGSKTAPTPSVVPNDSGVGVKDTVMTKQSEHYTVGDALYFAVDGYFSFLKASIKTGLILTGSIFGICVGIGLINSCCTSCNQ
jgi:uncharacterized protein YceK